MRCTVCGEIEPTTPSASSWRANSARSQCDSERPSLSGRSHAILTRWTATSGGKDRRPTGALTVPEPGDPVAAEAVDPLVEMASLHADQATRRRDGDPLGERQDGPCPPDQPGGDTGAPLQRFEFLPLLRGQRHDATPDAIRHGGLRVRKDPDASRQDFGIINCSPTSGDLYLASW